jgi:DNA-binding NtrC family response regulator
MLPISVSARNWAAFQASGTVPKVAEPQAGACENSTAPAEKVRTRRVLVVDDEPLIRWSLGEGLIKAGYEVAEAGDARGALHALQFNGSFDAVLLDLRLPDSADLALLAKIRAYAPDLPVIMMTAYGSPETRDEALKLGAREVISKPFDLNLMIALVAASLA